MKYLIILCVLASLACTGHRIEHPAVRHGKMLYSIHSPFQWRDRELYVVARAAQTWNRFCGRDILEYSEFGGLVLIRDASDEGLKMVSIAESGGTQMIIGLYQHESNTVTLYAPALLEEAQMTRTVLHEFGHALGLYHADPKLWPHSMMAPFDETDAKMGTYELLGLRMIGWDCPGRG